MPWSSSAGEEKGRKGEAEKELMGEAEEYCVVI